MGKKRVFELARELGYQNRDLIEKLQKVGIDVKSHSSTIDEEEARRALRKADDDKKARTDEQRLSGSVIRRRPKDEEVARPVTVLRRRSEAAEPAPAEQAAVVVRRRPAAEPAKAPEPPTPQPEAAPAAPPAPEPVHAEAQAPVEAAPVAPIAPVAEAPEAAAPVPDQPVEAPVVPLEVAPAPEVVEAPGAAAATATPSAAAEAPAAEPAAAGEDDDQDAEGRRERREARTARPDRKREEDYDEEDDKPDVEDFGISEFDFVEREQDQKSARVAPPPPSTIVTPKKEEVPQTRILRQIDPNVLKARLKQSKRPEPPKEWGKQAPEIAASPVTELVVRTDASGKRKELVDVRKEAAKGKGPGRAGARRKEEMTAKDLLEHRRGQVYYPAPSRKKVKAKRPGKRPDQLTPQVKQTVQIGDTITIAELSQQMSRKATELISFLMRNGVMAGINQPIDHDTAVRVCEAFGYEIESLQLQEEALLTGTTLEEAKRGHDANAEPRAPVVTVMGHVDHGKTSLLDRIRKTNVAGGEAGGITQRIAGYQVSTAKGTITFLDTPGHAAFTAMRARGANITDVVVLVVAADDGVMPQTREAVEHAKAAGVPMIVAVNKIDKPDANPDRVLQQLADIGILVEDWGGEVLSRRISAKTGDGVDELLELIALQTEIMELRAVPEAPAVGTVVEGHVHKGRGPVATVLIQEGTLQVGDVVVVGESIGRVRAMIADGGRRVKEAGPSVPVELLGLDAVPNPGDKLRVAQDLDAAKSLAAHRREKRRQTELSGTAKVSLQDLFNRIKTGDQKELKLIIKADVQGSVEALKSSLTDLSTQKVKVSVISGGVGAVTESDVEFAKASEAIIIGFAVRPDTKALKAARAMDVDVRSYDIIYEAVDEVKLAMRGLLAPVQKERYLGRAEVRQTFSVPKVGTVAGCAVVDGILTRSASIRLLRDGKTIYDGKLASLKRFKDDVREVKEGFECGMGIERFNDLKEGDIIEAYEMVMTEAVLDEPTQGKNQPEARP